MNNRIEMGHNGHSMPATMGRNAEYKEKEKDLAIAGFYTANHAKLHVKLELERPTKKFRVT